MSKPLIDQWLSDGKYTCTIKEFANLYGFREERARELCHSATPPPGFYSGNRYRILVDQIEDYMTDLARKRRTVNV